MGKYHPHGDTAIYDTLVRMAQEFSMRHVLVDGQGNFGSVDGDNAAAMRYTEVRLARLAEEMLGDDLDKETVEWLPNYDGSLKEPAVLPREVPEPAGQRLVGHRGRDGHQHPAAQPRRGDRRVRRLRPQPRHHPRGADQAAYPAPTSRPPGSSAARPGFARRTRPGTARCRCRRVRASSISKKGDRVAIIVTELPYQVNKARLVERIAELVQAKDIEGVSDLRDESDRDGMRVVVELKRDAVPQVVLNQLFKLTPMQTSFGITFLAIVDNQPRVLTLQRDARVTSSSTARKS